MILLLILGITLTGSIATKNNHRKLVHVIHA